MPSYRRYTCYYSDANATHSENFDASNLSHARELGAAHFQCETYQIIARRVCCATALRQLELDLEPRG